MLAKDFCRFLTVSKGTSFAGVVTPEGSHLPSSSGTLSVATLIRTPPVVFLEHILFPFLGDFDRRD
jgi:hypothetical protein